MSNVPISGLPLTTSVCATALVPIVQNGVTCSTYACLLGSGGGGGGVTQITAGAGVTISPSCGTGNVTICASGGGGGLTSVGLTMPSAFCVCGSPLTCNGSICVSACGTDSQIISGCGGLISAGIGITISGGQICSTGGGSSVMAAGSGTCSIVGSGCGNIASGNYSFAGGGCSNAVCCDFAFSGGGVGNLNNGIYNFIGGGQSNSALGNYNFIGGGQGNTSCNIRSFIGGGNNNNAIGCNSTILSGTSNNACGCYSSVLGGCGNTALCNYTGVFGCGLCNTQPCTFMSNNFVVGDFVGCNGCSLALDVNGKICIGAGGAGGVTSIVQGTGICISPSCGIGTVTICATGGGSSPIVSGSGTCSILGNGCGNTSTAAYHVTVGGQCNNSGNCACYGAIVGGFCNCSQAKYGFIGGGCNNATTDPLGIKSFTVVTGGCSNSAYASASFIGGGLGNLICTNCSIIVGGCGNSVGFYPSGAGCFNTIVGGQFNITGGNSFGGIFTGYCNCNTFTCAVFSAGDANFAITLGGCCNYNTSCFGLIGNGYNNCFQNLFGYNQNGSIINGNNNIICMAQLGVILSGNNNKIQNNCSAVINGSFNTLNATHGTVFSGSNNCVTGNCDNVFGFCNTLRKTNYSNIFGFRNCIDTSITCSCDNCYNFIQGDCNCIINGITPSFYIAPCNGVIFGTCNIICTPTNGQAPNHVYVFGCGLVGTAQQTAYFNNVCICGNLAKNFGSFKIPHPDPIKAEEGKFLKHSFVESPTAGDNIYRYNVTTSNCSASIDLPDYYNLLNTDTHIHLTPNSHFGAAYGKLNDDNTKINICSNSDGDYYLLVIGTRKDDLAVDNWNGTEVYAIEQKNK